MTLGARPRINRSGTITTGGSAQSLAPEIIQRVGFALQNQSTGDLWIYESGDAVASQPSWKIPAGAYFEFPGQVPNTALSIIGATTGQAFAAREW